MLSNIEHNNVNNVYNDIADHFNVTRVNKWPWITEFINNFKKNSLIVDLGCGNGRNMDYDNLNFIGVDNCSKFVDICKSKNYNVINSNITSVDLESNIADGIICIAVFHHLSTVEHRIDALKEMRRLLKPGCKLLLSVWSINKPYKTKRSFSCYGNNIVIWNSYNKKYERYYYIFKLDEIKNLFKSTGFTILKYEYSCGNEIFTLLKI